MQNVLLSFSSFHFSSLIEACHFSSYHLFEIVFQLGSKNLASGTKLGDVLHSLGYSISLESVMDPKEFDSSFLWVNILRNIFMFEFKKNHPDMYLNLMTELDKIIIQKLGQSIDFSLQKKVTKIEIISLNSSALNPGRLIPTTFINLDSIRFSFRNSLKNYLGTILQSTFSELVQLNLLNFSHTYLNFVDEFLDKYPPYKQILSISNNQTSQIIVIFYYLFIILNFYFYQSILTLFRPRSNL